MKRVQLTTVTGEAQKGDTDVFEVQPHNDGYVYLTATPSPTDLVLGRLSLENADKLAVALMRSAIVNGFEATK